MRKKRILSLLMTLVLMTSLLPHTLAVSARNFADVSEDSWYYEYVDFVTNKGYFTGTSETTFSPDVTMTRAMFVTVLASLDDADINNSVSAFVDVPTDTWFTGSVTWASENGIVTGIGDNRFNPDGAITRQEMCVIMDRFITYYGEKTNQIHKTEGSTTLFPDNSRISSWARTAVANCREYGLITGYEDGLFHPLDNSTRAQVATVISRLAWLVKPEENPNRGGGGGGGGGGGTTTYTVTLKDGDTVLSTNSVVSGRSYTLPSWPKEGYTLLGWSLADDSTVDSGYSIGNAITVTANITLYAVWGEDLIGDAVETTVKAFNEEYEKLKESAIAAVREVGGDYLTDEQVDQVVGAIQSMVDISTVSHDQDARTVTADISLRVTKDQPVSLIEEVSDLLSNAVDGSTSVTVDDVEKFIQAVRDQVEKVTGIDLTDPTLSAIRQQVIDKVVGAGKEMWSNFYDEGGYYTGNVTLTAGENSVTIIVDDESKTTTLDGVTKTQAVRDMALAIAQDMFGQLKEQSGVNGGYVSDADLSGTVAVRFSRSATEEYAAKTDLFSYNYTVTLNVKLDSDGLISYKEDNGNYIKLTITKDIQDAYNNAIMEAAAGSVSDEDTKNKVVDAVKSELESQVTTIYNTLKSKLEKYGVSLSADEGTLTGALKDAVPAWVEANWTGIVTAAAGTGSLEDLDNTLLVDAAWNVLKQDVPQTNDEMDGLLQDLIKTQLEANSIDDAWLVNAANENELLKQIRGLSDLGYNPTFYDEHGHAINMDLEFESADDINELLTVFRVSVGGLSVTGDPDENGEATAFGDAVRTTIVEAASDELIAKLGESPTFSELIGTNDALQDYLVYSALCSLNLNFNEEKTAAYKDGAVLDGLDELIESTAKEEMSSLLSDELAKVDVEEYLDELDDYEAQLELLNSLTFPGIQDETFAGLAAHLRGQTLAELVGNRGNAVVEKYLDRVVNALNSILPDGASITINGVKLDKEDLAAFENVDTTEDLLTALADVLDDFGDLCMDDFAELEGGIPVAVKYNTRTFNFKLVIEVEQK